MVASIKLKQLLNDSSYRWRENAKLLLVVILANALYNLYSGPWMQSHWPKDDIVFFLSDGFVFTRPFLQDSTSRFFHEPLQTSSEELRKHHGQNSSENFHQYPILLGFAVTLIEVLLSKSLETYLERTDPLTDLNDLWAGASEAYEEMKVSMKVSMIARNYSNVIGAC
jgi:hypothetical protein